MCIFYFCVLTAFGVLLLLLYLGIVIALYLAPLGIDSPCFMEHSQLPPKPALFGHRGAPMVSSQHLRLFLQHEEHSMKWHL